MECNRPGRVAQQSGKPIMIAAVASRGRHAVASAIDELDLAALGGALWRRKGRIAALTLLAGGLAFAAVNMVTPRYKSEARVLIETRDNIFLRPDAEKALDRGGAIDQEAVTSQVQLILSRDLAREVIKTLKLGERAEFDPVLRGSSTIGVLLGVVGLVRDPMSQTPEERVFRSFAERLTAYQVEKSRVIAIEFESESPDLAARVANTLAETYLMFQQTAKQDQSRVAGLWLAEKIEPLRGAVADAEAKVEQYRARNNLLIGTNNTTLSNQQLGELNGQLSAGRAQKADAEVKARIIRDALRTGAAVEFADIINSELMRRLSEQRVTLRAQLAEQSSTLLDQHPRIKELRAQIADLDRQIRAEADRLARALENDARVVSAKVDSLGASLEQLKRQAGNTNEQDVQLRALEREAKAQRELLESYLAKYREATTRDSVGAGSPDARIISTAIVSNTPSWPKKLPTVLIAALGTFALTVAFALSGQLLSGQFSTAAQSHVAYDLAALHPIPPAAEYPVGVSGNAEAHEQDRGRLQEQKENAHAPASEPHAPLSGLQGASALQTAADEMIGAVTSRLMGRVAVIGVCPGVQTVPIAVLLARTLAGKGKVVLLDLAPGGSGLSALGADPSAPGICDLVAGAASFGEIIARDRHSGTHFIAAGRARADVASIVQSPRLVITVEALARSYDHVVINAGTLPDLPVEAIAALALQAVLVADALDDPISASAQEHLLAAGFSAVSVLQGWSLAPGPDGSTARAAA
jgi:succinoglycan biosynthesis transport protein ExoP